MSLAIKNGTWMEIKSRVNTVLEKFTDDGETFTTGSGTTAISQIDGALSVGTGAIAYLSGTIIADALPTSDPEVEGQFWNDSGAVKVSAG